MKRAEESKGRECSHQTDDDRVNLLPVGALLLIAGFVIAYRTSQPGILPWPAFVGCNAAMSLRMREG